MWLIDDEILRDLDTIRTAFDLEYIKNNILTWRLFLVKDKTLLYVALS